MDIYAKIERVRITEEISSWHLIFTKKVPRYVLTIGNRWVVTINHHTGEVLFDRHGLQVRLNAKPTEQPTEEEKVLATILFQLLLSVHTTGTDTTSIQLEYAVDEEMGKFLLSHVITARPVVLEIPLAGGSLALESINRERT